MSLLINNPDPRSFPPRHDLGADGNTIGDMIENRAKKTPSATAYRSKKSGQWQDTSWAEVYAQSQQVALGLLAHGLQFGDRVAIVSNTREEWAIAAFGIFLAGGVLVPVYPSNPEEACTYLLQHSESVFVFVENEKQLQKLRNQRNQLPQMRKVFVLDPAATTPEGSDWIDSFDALKKQGTGSDPSILSRTASHITPKSVAAIVYTSGTTGQPKGAILLHESFVVGTRYALGSTPASFEDLHLMFLPMAHSFALMLTLYSVRVGFTTAFAESMDKIADNITEIRPTCIIGVPRIFEKIYQGFLHKVEESGTVKKKLARWALSVGSYVSKSLQQGEKPGLWLALQYWLATKLVYQKLQNKLGGRIRWLVSGSAPLAVEVAEFFHAAGMLILEGYGLTETNSVTTVNRMSCFQFGTVGYVHDPDLQIKIASDGEILTKGIIQFVGYFKQPEATREAIDEEGWFHTGDVGSIDDRGFLTITERKKDLIKTSGGKFVAPQFLEGKLKMSPLISQAVVIGDRRPYITALLTIYPDAAKRAVGGGTWTHEALSQHPAVVALVEKHLQEVNRTLGSWEQIKYFKMIPQEFTEAGGELTPSMKIKRRAVVEKYKDLIQSMYDDHMAPRKW